MKEIKDLENHELKIGDNVVFALTVPDDAQPFALDDAGTSRLGYGTICWIDEESESAVIGSINNEEFILKRWLGVICVKPRKIGDFVIGDRVAFENNNNRLDSGEVLWINDSQPPTFATIRCGNGIILKSSSLIVSVQNKEK